MLNTMLWIAQAFLALVMAMAGLMKLSRSREQLAERFHWAAAWPRWQIKLLGLAEVAGAIGLVAPIAAGVAPFLTPLAAACLSVLMIGAARTHRELGERIAFPVVLAALCVFVAAGRIAEHAAARPAIAEGRQLARAPNSRGDDAGWPQDLRGGRRGSRGFSRSVDRSHGAQHAHAGTSLAFGNRMEALDGDVVGAVTPAQQQRASRADRAPDANTKKGESP